MLYLGRIIIVGGGVAGSTVATTYRELGGKDDIWLISDEPLVYTKHNISNFISNPYISIQNSIIYTYKDLVNNYGIKFLNTCKVIDINFDNKTIKVYNRVNKTFKYFTYDQLIIATGSVPFIPPIEGKDLKNVMKFHTLYDALKLRNLPSQINAIVIGGGLVGLLAAYELSKKNVRVAVLEALPYILPGVIDPEISTVVLKYFKSKGVKIYTSSPVRKILGTKSVNGVLSDKIKLRADVVIFATGVRPNTKWLSGKGIKLGFRDSIVTDDQGRTNVVDVYAVGDCALSLDFITKKLTYRPLGFVAGYVAQIISKNLVGIEESYKGIIPVIYEKFGELQIYRIGLSAAEASALGLTPYTLKYFNERSRRWELLIIEKGSEKIIGWEAVTYYPIHSLYSWMFYIAIKEGMNLSELNLNIAIPKIGVN